MPSEVPNQLSLYSAGPSAPHRPFGLVWIVFYWVLEGLACVVSGSIAAMTFSFVPSMFLSMFLHEVPPIRSTEGRMVWWVMKIMTEGMGLLSLCIFHLGLFTLVVCYGLWSFRAWGLRYARPLSMLYAVLGGLFLLLIFLGGSIVILLTNLVISICIMIYFWYGLGELWERLRKYYQQLPSSPTRGE